MIEHPSRACRTCRTGKPQGWIVGQTVKEIESPADDEEDEDEP